MVTAAAKDTRRQNTNGDFIGRRGRESLQIYHFNKG